MLTYITIFVACVILAFVIRFIFKAVADSSSSLTTSKDGIALVASTPGNKKHRTARKTTTGASLARTSTAKAGKQVDWDWQGDGKRVRKPQAAASAGAGNHCSLYDVDAAEPPVNHSRDTGWPYREEKRTPRGKTYKVSRKATPKTTKPVTVAKPWGW